MKLAWFAKCLSNSCVIFVHLFWQYILKNKRDNERNKGIKMQEIMWGGFRGTIEQNAFGMKEHWYVVEEGSRHCK